MTAYDMRISDWSSDVCSSDLHAGYGRRSEQLDRALLLRRKQLTGCSELLEEMQAVSATALGVIQRLIGTSNQRRWDEALFDLGSAEADRHLQIGRASCRARVCQYV